MGGPTHLLLSCNLPGARRTALDQGWLLVGFPPRSSTAVRPDGGRVDLTSDIERLRDLPAEATLYLGFRWILAHGVEDPRTHIEAHLARGGSVVDLTVLQSHQIKEPST